MKNQKRLWGRTLSVIIALMAVLSIVLTACAPANPDLSGAAGGGKGTEPGHHGNGSGGGQGNSSSGGQGNGSSGGQGNQDGGGGSQSGSGGDKGGQGGEGGGQGGNGGQGGSGGDQGVPTNDQGGQGGNGGEGGIATQGGQGSGQGNQHEVLGTPGAEVLARCVLNPSDPACKNPEHTACNANNPKNCPNPPEICGLGMHVGNPHCKTPTPTEPPVCTTGNCTPGTPIEPPTLAAVPNIEVNARPQSCQDWIAFHSFRTGNLQVFRLDGVEGAPGAKLVNLSNSSGMDSRPSRSPNDAEVVFQSDRHGNVELYLTDSLGTSRKRLTTTQANNVNAMFSPDNQHVIYQSDRNGNWDIYLLDTKTGVDQQLTSSPGDDVNAYWSPDSNWLVFQSNRTGTWNIYLLNVSTGTEYTFSDFPYDAAYPSWSPNGKQLAFLTNWNNSWSLYVSDLQGDNVKQITQQGNAGNISWSPEGDRLAFQIDNGQDNTDVFSYDLVNNKQYKLTDFTGPDSAPTWDCGGNNLSFTSTSGGSPNIYSVPWQGGDISYITNSPATNKWSEWSPSKEPGSRGN